MRLKSYDCSLNIFFWILIGAVWIVFLMMLSSGLWSVSMVTSDFPYSSSQPNNISEHLFFNWCISLFCWGQRSFSRSMADPNPFSEASTTTVSGFVALKYFKTSVEVSAFLTLVNACLALLSKLQCPLVLSSRRGALSSLCFGMNLTKYANMPKTVSSPSSRKLLWLCVQMASAPLL